MERLDQQLYYRTAHCSRVKSRSFHFQSTDLSPFVWSNSNKQSPYMCIYMNMNVESRLPLVKYLLHLYLYCVCPFSQISSSVSSYRISCELKLCSRTRSWQSAYSHLNGNLCFFLSLKCSMIKKNKNLMWESPQTWGSDFVHGWCCFKDVLCKFLLATERDLMTVWQHSGKFLGEKEIRDQMRGTGGNER